MSTYQKVYTDHVYSSTLMCQFTQLWKNRLMCDARIISGETIIQAHRLLLVASCPVLQSQDCTTRDSVLEITLPDNIRPETIYTFLEFLYEGHMILTEHNIHSLEQIARLMHVDRILKCCSDFSKSLKSSDEKDIFNFHDLQDANHVRVTRFIKTKRDSFNLEGSDKIRPGEPKPINSLEDKELNSLTNKKTSSFSFATTPVITETQHLQLRKEYSSSNLTQQTSSDNSLNASQRENTTKHSIIDLSHGYSSVSSSGTDSETNSRFCQNYSNESALSNINLGCRHNDQNISRPSSVDTASHRNNALKLQDNYNRSLSDESMNHTNLRNTVAINYASQCGFAMPSLSSPVWSDSNGSKIFRSSFNNGMSTPNLKTSPGLPSVRENNNSSVTSHQGTRFNQTEQGQHEFSSSNTQTGMSQHGYRISSSLTRKSPLDTRISNIISQTSPLDNRRSNNQGTSSDTNQSDVPVTVRQEDNSLVLDVDEIDLSMIKTENVEEPLDLHVEGMIQEAEDRLDASEDTLHIPDDIKFKNYSNQETGSIDYGAVYNDISKQWASQSETLKKRPQNKSANVRRIIQDLNLNRRALASPAALGSIAVGNHKPVRMPGKNNYKVCSLCYRNKIRTKSGYYVYSYYKCSVCDVPLCIGSRKCFLQYHRGAETEEQS